ncbi:retrovirus-related pol polyprotein LINE-1, partial [Tanacetum coccineum]
KPIRVDESDMIWLHYTRELWKWKKAKNFVTYCFDENETIEVKECGARIVCDEDLDQEGDLRTPRRYIRVIRHMYDDAKTRARTSIGNTEFFPVEVGLHQGSAVSPYLFALILDELSRRIQENIPWCLIFADDIVLV